MAKRRQMQGKQRQPFWKMTTCTHAYRKHVNRKVQAVIHCLPLWKNNAHVFLRKNTELTFRKQSLQDNPII